MALSLAAGGQPISTEDRDRNSLLLAGYDYGRYPEQITGYNGQNLQTVIERRFHSALRVRVGPRGNYKGAICRLSSGTLLVAACRRINDLGLFGVHIYESRDQGLNWTEIGESELLGKEMSLTPLPDEGVFMTVESSAFAPDRTRMHHYRSVDGGRMWESDSIPGPGKPRNVLTEKDGSLLMVRPLGSAYLQGLYDSASATFEPSPHLELMRSTDAGHSWIASEGKVDWDNARFGEVSVTRLSDGRLLAALRGHPSGQEGHANQVTYLTRSADDGDTWCRPWLMGNAAEVQVNLLTLHDGRVLATYTNYHLPFGICAVVSRDDGQTWSYIAPIQLAMSADCNTGWPVTAELDGDELITSYAITAYLNEPQDPSGASRNVCEVVRWRLPHDASSKEGWERHS